MFSFFKDYFTFSRGERNGIIVLLLVITLLIIAYYLPDHLMSSAKIDFSVFEKEISEFEKKQAMASARKSAEHSAVSELFLFDPNEISAEEWKKLGVHERTVRTIMNYRSKGGYFDDKSDLLKIYGFDSAKYEMLEPYIVFSKEEEPLPDPLDKTAFRKPERTYKEPKKFSYERKAGYKPKEIAMVELNFADSLSLDAVKGIGPAMSQRIIKYRNALGGFAKVEQLMEVYGMDSAWFEVMKPSLTVDSGLVAKIDINTVAEKDMAKHPYFGWNVAKAIVNYRKQHGRFREVADLRKIYLIDENLFRKIEPYVTVE